MEGFDLRFGNNASAEPAQGYFINAGYWNHYPKGRGSIHITAANDVYAAPNFNTGFLSHPADIATLIWGYKKFREIIRRMITFRAEILETHPPFPAGSAAVPINHNDPNLRDTEYSPEDDQILEKWIRGTMGTTWHSMLSTPSRVTLILGVRVL